MKKKISIVLVLSMSLLACKKEEPDNPNINHRTVNLEMKVSSYNAESDMSIDMNDDGMLDFEIELDLYRNSDSELEYYAAIDYEQTGNEVLTQAIDGDEYIISLNKNDLISGGSSTWYRYATIFELDRDPGYPELSYGFAGKGDLLVGVRFMIGSQLHYGWMKVNASTDYKTIIVKEVAYEIRPNVEVRAGEK
jgi:hypothetical protein